MQQPLWQALTMLWYKAHKQAGAVSQTETNSCCPLMLLGKNRGASFFRPCWRAVLSSPFLMLNQQILVMKGFFCSIIFLATLKLLSQLYT